MSHSYETLLFEVDENNVGLLTINRPDKMNALNNQVLTELDEVVDAIKNDKKIGALIITGSGEKAFVAGADIKELSAVSPQKGAEFARRGQKIFQKIEDFEIPVIAAVNGYALGGGCELAMACHIRIASPKAVMGLPEVSLGIIPGYGGTQRLAQLTGKAKALELILTGRFVKADEAAQIGLVNKVAEESALDEAHFMLNAIMKQGPVAVRQAIKAVRNSGTENGYLQEADLFGELCETSDFKEGTQAFLEKRKPDFSGK